MELGFLIALAVAGAVAVFNFWQNQSAGYVHLRSGPFADRKTQPVVFWGCQIFFAVLAIASLAAFCATAFGVIRP